MTPPGDMVRFAVWICVLVGLCTGVAEVESIGGFWALPVFVLVCLVAIKALDWTMSWRR